MRIVEEFPNEIEPFAANGMLLTLILRLDRSSFENTSLLALDIQSHPPKMLFTFDKQAESRLRQLVALVHSIAGHVLVSAQ